MGGPGTYSESKEPGAGTYVSRDAMSRNYQEIKPAMSFPRCSRRAFLRTTLLGATVSLAGRGFAAATPVVAVNSNLYFFEIDAVGGGSGLAMPELQLTYEPVSLDDPHRWHSMLETLATRPRGLVIVARPATVFAVRNMLPPGWRIVLAGRHQRTQQNERRHVFEGIDTPLSDLTKALPQATNFAQYAALLGAMPNRPDTGPLRTLTRESPAWPGTDCASLLAWSPRGVA
jgi:hypothetical protein